MKKDTFLNPIGLMTLLCIILFNQCDEPKPNQEQNAKQQQITDCCTGYTGPVTNHLADLLQKKDNFITKDSIDAWTKRYQANKGFIGQTGYPSVKEALGDSSSFNRCIIKSIICNDSCIGLRVVYGMSPDLKVHVIMVGIKPDYSTLYIKRSETCFANTKNESTKATIQPNKAIKVASMFDDDDQDPDPSDPGGAEYGMEP